MSKIAAGVAAEAVDAFNRVLGRQCEVRPWIPCVAKALRAGHTVEDMHAAIFFVEQRWSEELKANISPLTLFKLTSTQGKGTLPEYAAQGRELWHEQFPGEDYPWKK